MEDKKRRHELIKIVMEVSQAVNSSLDPDEVEKLVLKEAREVFEADHAALFILDDNSERFILCGVEGFSEDEVDNIKLLSGWEAINEYLIKRKIPMLVNDIHNDPIFRDQVLPLSRDNFPIESFLAVPLQAREKIIGALLVSNRNRPGHLFDEEDKELLITLSNNIAIALLNAKLYNKLKSLFISTITSLARAIDAKDAYTSGHSERVTKYALLIGQEMGLDKEALENLKLASLLHDVGKIGIRESILMKPAKLLGFERKQIMEHPAIGARIIESIQDSYKIMNGVIEHHERWDGNGYPNHLKGEEISLDGRIIAVADAFDALTSDRPYQKGFSKEEALKKIVEASGTQFDPAVVKAFKRIIKL